MHKVFISYHHKNDQFYKEALLRMNNLHKQIYGSYMFIDRSADTGNISEELTDEMIRQKIRDEYLQDSTATILLLGTETKYRKHIDWEIYSSMHNGKVNKQSGILVINLPTIQSPHVIAGHGEERQVYPEIPFWTVIKTREGYEQRCPYMPERIIDNLLHSEARISVTNWNKIVNSFDILKFLIGVTFKHKDNCSYNLSRPMRRKNFNPSADLFSLINQRP